MLFDLQNHNVFDHFVNLSVNSYIECQLIQDFSLRFEAKFMSLQDFLGKIKLTKVKRRSKAVQGYYFLPNIWNRLWRTMGIICIFFKPFGV